MSRPSNSRPSNVDAPETTVVVATRDRVSELAPTLRRLTALPDRPPIIVVDNGSTDGTVDRVRRDHPEVTLIPLGDNLGAGARTVGARVAATPYVAFSDDDSWWAPGALRRAAVLFAAHPRLGLLCARILVGADERCDPTCAAMTSSPLPAEPDLPGPAIRGFVACGAIVRRGAFLGVGGFEPRLGIGGEEDLLAMDLAAAGWGLAYVRDVVAHHHPSQRRDPSHRTRRLLRNQLWTTWLRRTPGVAGASTLAALRAAMQDAEARAGLWEAVRDGRWVLPRRRPLPAEVEASLRRLERSRSAALARPARGTAARA